MLNRLISVAPMMACTDRHYRMLVRQISRHTLLYTEMVTTGALLHNDPARFLSFSTEEHPLALQLGGSCPKELACCATLAEQLGYDEVNLNVGCPSKSVQSGRFGACLMKSPDRVAECVAAMQAAVNIPVTVKTRIGVDEQDSYAELHQFIKIVSSVGCGVFIIHARKAWLKGLNPKQNREIPPLCYDRVHRLKQDFPQLQIIINGGINTLENIQMQLQQVDGVMIGRQAYHNPYLLVDFDHLFFRQKQRLPTRKMIFMNYLPYVVKELAKGVPFHLLTRHLLGLFQSQPGAKRFRRAFSENCYAAGHSSNDKLAMLKLALDQLG